MDWIFSKEVWGTEWAVAMAWRLDLLQILELLFHWNTFAFDVRQSLINTILRQNWKQPEATIKFDDDDDDGGDDDDDDTHDV